MRVSAIQGSSAVEDCFFRDILTLRENARRIMAVQAPQPDDHNAAAANSLALLQDVLAAEIVCVLRYTAISVSPIGLRKPEIAREFQAQASDERRHMEMTVRRIRQLGGVPDFNPASLTSQDWRCAASALSLMGIIEQNLALEELIVAHYQELRGYFSTRDPATSLLLQAMLQDEESHSADLQDFLAMQNRLDDTNISWEISEV